MNNGKFLTTAARLANIFIVSGGIVCLLALSYVVYYYSWTDQRQLTSWKGVLLYYVSPALLAIAFFASLRLRAVHRINLALSLFSAGVSVCALESLLTVWFSLPSVTQDLNRKIRSETANAMGVDFDTRSKRQVVNDLRSRGTEAIPSVNPMGLLKEQDDGTMKSLVSATFDGLPLASIANKLNVLCNESGQFVTFRSDEHGFSNPPNSWDKAPIDIAAVGDSFVQGWCVPPDKTFVALIRKSYPATLNLGIEGNGPLIMLATIKEYAQVVKPKVLLWFYYEDNDLDGLSVERKTPLLTSYLSDTYSRDLFARQPEIDRALTDYIKTAIDKNVALIKLEEISALVRGDPNNLPNVIEGIIKLSQVRQRLGLVQGREAVSSEGNRAQSMRPLTDLFYEVLLEAKKSAGGWGGSLYFVYLPGWLRYAPGKVGNPDRDAVMQVVAKVGLPVIDVHEVFKAQEDPLSLFPLRFWGAHYTEEGNRIVAQYVLQSISAGETK